MKKAAPVIAALLALSAGTAHAQAKIILRLADTLGSGHLIHELVGKPFSEQVTKATNGQVKFQHFPGEQLGKAKDMAKLTVAGVADVAYIEPAYASGKYPLSAVGELPGIYATECQGSLAFHRISHNGGILEREEFAPNQLRPLVTIALPAYQVQLARARAAMSARDLEGLRIRTPGGIPDITMRLLKGVPVRMAESGIRASLSRGALDGVLLPYQGSNAYAPGQLLKSGTEGPGFGHVIFTYAIGQLKWRTLPETVRKILDEAGERVTREGCKRLEDQEAEAAGSARAQGMQAIAFSASDNKALGDAFARVSQEWAQELDRRGKPGTAVLKAFTAAVAASR